MARYGKTGRSYGLGSASEDDVKRFYAAHGYDYSSIIEQAREFLAHLPLLWVWEPFSFDMGVPAGGYGAIKGAGEKVLASLEGESGRFVMVEYMDRFEQATKHLHRSIDEMSHGEFLSAISDGVSSIEAYLGYRTGLHNERHPGQELSERVPTGSGHRMLTFDEKIDQWIPKMTGGRKLDKNGRRWPDFKELRKIRNDYQAHPKNPVYGLPFRELCKRMNLFRTGIARLLLNLHAGLEDSAPELVFRYAYLPDIEYVQEPN